MRLYNSSATTLVLFPAVECGKNDRDQRKTERRSAPPLSRAQRSVSEAEAKRKLP